MNLLNLNVGIKIDNLDAVKHLVKQQSADLCTFQEAMNAIVDTNILNKKCF